MIYEYTEAELQELQDFEDKQNARSKKLQSELQGYRKGSKKYNECNEKLAAVIDDFFRGYDELDNKFAKAHFEKLGTDPQAILDDGKKQIPMIIESTYTGRQNNDLVMNDAGEMQPRSADPKIEMGEAVEILNHELRLYFDALGNDSKRYKELRDSMYKYLGESPYIYTSSGTDNAKKEKPNESLFTRPTPPITKTAGILNDKTTRAIVSGNMLTRELNGQIEMILSTNEAPGDAEKQVVNTISMRYEGDDIRIAKRLTAFDTAVLNAVSTLYFYQAKGDRKTAVYITPEEIWRTMNGIKDSRKPVNKNQKARVEKSFDKMRYTNFYMDISQEVKANYITLNDERLTNGHIETYLLKAEKVSFKSEKGKEVTGYRVENEPILYTYNAAKNHVLFVDYDLLDTSDKTGNEGYTIEFRTYLLQQIELMKSGIRNSNRILYSTIYTDTAIPAPADRINKEKYTTENSYKTTVKREAKNDRDKINALLASWKAKGYIKDYSPAMKGRSYIGIDIKLPAKKQDAIE